MRRVRSTESFVVGYRPVPRCHSLLHWRQRRVDGRRAVVAETAVSSPILDASNGEHAELDKVDEEEDEEENDEDCFDHEEDGADGDAADAKTSVSDETG